MRPDYPVITRGRGMEEDSDYTLRFGDGSSAVGSAAGLNDQDHARPERGHVAVIALQGSHCGLVRSGDRVESFAGLHPVMNRAGLG